MLVAWLRGSHIFCRAKRLENHHTTTHTRLPTHATHTGTGTCPFVFCCNTAALVKFLDSGVCLADHHTAAAAACWWRLVSPARKVRKDWPLHDCCWCVVGGSDRQPAAYQNTAVRPHSIRRTLSTPPLSHFVVVCMSFRLEVSRYSKQ